MTEKFWKEAIRTHDHSGNVNDNPDTWTGNALGVGSVSFLGLCDVIPKSYLNQEGKILVVTQAADGICFGETVTDFDARYVKKAGDTMIGPLTLSGAPTVDLHASTKKYVDDEIVGLQEKLIFDDSFKCILVET